MLANASRRGAPLPPAVRRLWKWFLLPLIFVIAGTIANRIPALRIASGGQSPWIWIGIPALCLGLNAVMVLGVWLGLRRIKRDVRAASGRACTTCTHDLRGLGESGTCPECGGAFDIAADRLSWMRAKVL